MQSENEIHGLESALIRAGRELSFPATPSIAARVKWRLDAEHQTKDRRGLHTGWMLLATALVLLIAVVGFPEMPRAVGFFFATGSVRAATLTPKPSVTPTLASLLGPIVIAEKQAPASPAAAPIPDSENRISGPTAFMTPTYTAQNNAVPSRPN